MRPSAEVALLNGAENAPQAPSDCPNWEDGSAILELAKARLLFASGIIEHALRFERSNWWRTRGLDQHGVQNMSYNSDPEKPSSMHYSLVEHAYHAGLLNTGEG